jgi:hypothetical protein
MFEVERSGRCGLAKNKTPRPRLITSCGRGVEENRIDLATEHFRNDEDQEGSAESASEEEVDQRIADRSDGKDGMHDECGLMVRRMS